VPFTLKLPAKDDSGRQDLRVVIGNVGRQILQPVINAAAAIPPTPISVTYRVYIDTPSTPPASTPMNFSIFEVPANNQTLTAVASRADVLNRGFPKDVYRLDEFPGLDR